MKNRSNGKLALLFPLGFALIIASTIIADVTNRMGAVELGIFAIGLVLVTVGGWFVNRAIYGWYGQLFGMFTDKAKAPPGTIGSRGDLVLQKHEDEAD